MADLNLKLHEIILSNLLECYPILIAFQLFTWNSNNFSDKIAAFIRPNICENCFNYSQLTNEKIEKSWLVLIYFNKDLLILAKSRKSRSFN